MVKIEAKRADFNSITPEHGKLLPVNTGVATGMPMCPKGSSPQKLCWGRVRNKGSGTNPSGSGGLVWRLYPEPAGQTPRLEILMPRKKSPRQGATPYHRRKLKRIFTANLLFEWWWRVRLGIRVVSEKVVANR